MPDVMWGPQNPQVKNCDTTNHAVKCLENTNSPVKCGDTTHVRFNVVTPQTTGSML